VRTIPSELVKKGKLHYIDSGSSKVFHPETEVSQVIGLQEALAQKEDTLTFDVTPTENSLNPVTSGGVYLAFQSIDALPSQTNNSGKFLTTDGSSASWATVDALPSQTNNSGKVLVTNGTTASWANLNNAQQIFDVTSNTTSVTLNANNLPGSAFNYTISVYHDGLRLTQGTDYTYNSSTRTITFSRSFLNGDQVVVYIGVLAEAESMDEKTDNIHPSEKCIVNNNASGNISLNIDNAVIYNLNITGNCTLSFVKDSSLNIYSTNRSFTVTLLIKNGGTHTLIWPNSINWADNVAPTLSADNKYDIITLITFDSGTTWLGLTSGANYTIS
jgi:hypothetical protein